MTLYKFKLENGVIEPTEELAPVPAGVSCGKAISELKEGCRALKFEYDEGATTAKGEKASEWGEFTKHLSKVKYIAWNASKTKTETVVAEYAYDLKGRLRAEWNPQIKPATEDDLRVRHRRARHGGQYSRPRARAAGAGNYPRRRQPRPTAGRSRTVSRDGARQRRSTRHQRSTHTVEHQTRGRHEDQRQPDQRKNAGDMDRQARWPSSTSGRTATAQAKNARRSPARSTKPTTRSRATKATSWSPRQPR